jgi:hypothetical protein
LKSWLKKPAFQSMYAAARQRLLEQAMARLLALLGKASDALARSLDCGRAADETRAAGLIYSTAIKGVETLDLVRRIAELESRLAEQESGDDGNPDAEGGEARTGGPPPAEGDGPAAAPAAAGPEPDSDRGGPDAGPLAGGPAPLFPPQGPDALRPTGG